MICRTYGILCPVIDPVHHLMRARHPCLAISHEPMPIQLHLEMPGLLNLNHLQDLPKFLVRIPVHKRLLYSFIYTSFADHRCNIGWPPLPACRYKTLLQRLA